ncbi:MAG: hypothetical protein ACKV2T_21830 [Kofleriaceae bacterium]
MDRRALLIKNVAGMLVAVTGVLDAQTFFEGIRKGVWLETVPIGATVHQAISVIVDRAFLEGWAKNIFDKIPRTPDNSAELASLLDEIEEIKPTIADPFQEVLLEGTRPFAGRDDLRFALRELFRGSALLKIDGEEKTGKTFSFYLAQHIARQNGFIASNFDLGDFFDPEALAREVMVRLGTDLDTTKATGLESAQRSIGKEFADQVKNAIEEQKQKRVFVFDTFPPPNKPELPPETTSFIVRLVKYADEELRPLLRVVLVGFNGEISNAIDDVAETDEAHGFTDAEMLSLLKQVVTARNWNVSEATLQAAIAVSSTKSIRDRFRLMRDTIRKLARKQQATDTGVPT